MIESFTIISGIIAFFSIFFNWSIPLKQFIFWIFLISLIFFDGLRWETGTDWQNYHDAFANMLERGQPGFEIGFVLYTWIIRNLTDDYSIYLFITTAIIYIGIFYAIFRITNYSFISILYLTSVIPWYSGSLRQMMASVFFITALTFVYKKKLLKFLATMTIGALFHSTIFPFFIIYWLFGASFFSFTVLGLLLIVSSSIITFFIEKIDLLINLVKPGTSFQNRVGGNLDESSPAFGLIRKVLTVSLNFVFFKYAIIKTLFNDRMELNKIKFFLYLSSFSLIFYIVGTFFITHVSSRLDIYTGIICLAIFLGLMEKHIRSRKHLLYLYVFVVFLCVIFYMRLGYLDLFHPYKSIFYNIDYKRDLY